MDGKKTPYCQYVLDSFETCIDVLCVSLRRRKLGLVAQSTVRGPNNAVKMSFSLSNTLLFLWMVKKPVLSACT